MSTTDATDKEAVQCVRCGWSAFPDHDFSAGGAGGIRCLCELGFKFRHLPQPKMFTFSAEHIAMSKAGQL
jgi:hypothetical protein